MRSKSKAKTTGNNDLVVVDLQEDDAFQYCDDEFSTITVDVPALQAVSDECQYVKQLLAVSNLHMLQPGLVKNAYKNRKNLDYSTYFYQNNSWGASWMTVFHFNPG